MLTTNNDLPNHFIKERVGGASIQLARNQQTQLGYFTQSEIQQDITVAYIEAWANAEYRSNEQFLNWVKTVFRTDNFLSFFKYLRFPIASARLINERITTPLSRVFYSEDSFYNYTIKGESVECPESLQINDFNDTLFNALLFRHNDIIVHDLRDVNEPIRTLISIDNVVALESSNSVISRIAYTATIEHEGENVEGTLYIDDKIYSFYKKDSETPLVTIPHDLGECPADYISKESFGSDDILRKSIFSYSREALEEYCFLKTLQRMSEPNGAIPVVTILDAKRTGNTPDVKGSTDKEPMSQTDIGSQRAGIISEVTGSKSVLQTGTEIGVPMVKKLDGSIDTAFAKDFITFHYTPTESLTFINDRLEQIEQSIIVSLVGDQQEANEAAKNVDQVAKGFVSKEDKLRQLSAQLSRVRNRSDYKMLALEYGKDAVAVDCFYGSDFFLESQTELYNMFKESPNPIERKNILIRLAKNRSRFNPEKGAKEVILNKLLPYSSDLDFDKAIERNILDDITFQYQTRFDYWIGVFQANYGDILEFYKMLEGTEFEKLVVINNLIIETIKLAPIKEEVIEEENN